MKHVFLLLVLLSHSDVEKEMKGIFKVKTIALRKENISEYIYVYGKVISENTGYVISPMPGKLVNYTKPQGSFFKKDEPVAYVDRNVPGMKTNLLVIKAPFDGILAITYANEGDMVSQTKPIALFYSSSFYVEANVSASLLKKIRNGAECIIGEKKDEGKGRVESVSFGVDPNLGFGKIRVKVIQGKELIPGEVVSLSIETKSERNVFVVPLEAIVERDGKNFVFINENNKAKMIPVMVGIISENRAEVSSSLLKEGMEVITLGAQGLHDGDRVEPQEK